MPGDRRTIRRSTKAKGAGGRTEIATQPSTRACGRRRPMAADGRPMATHSHRWAKAEHTDVAGMAKRRRWILLIDF